MRCRFVLGLGFGECAGGPPVVVSDPLLGVQQLLDLIDVILLDLVLRRLFLGDELVFLLLGIVQDLAISVTWSGVAPTESLIPSRYILRNSMKLCLEFLALAVVAEYRRLEATPTRTPLPKTRIR